MFFTSSISTITPAMVSVAMSRSDSRDSNCSTTSSIAEGNHFTPAPMTVSYSTSPVSYLARTSSNMSSSTSSSSRRASSSTSRRESSSQWMPSPFRSCQVRPVQEASSYLSDDDLLYIAPPTTVASSELPFESIPQVQTRRELTTEEQIAMMRETQAKEQEQELISLQQQRRQAAAAAQKAVRFADQKPRRPSAMRRRTTVKKGLSQMSQ